MIRTFENETLRSGRLLALLQALSVSALGGLFGVLLWSVVEAEINRFDFLYSFVYITEDMTGAVAVAPAFDNVSQTASLAAASNWLEAEISSWAVLERIAKLSLWPEAWRKTETPPTPTLVREPPSQAFILYHVHSTSSEWFATGLEEIQGTTTAEASGVFSDTVTIYFSRSNGQATITPQFISGTTSVPINFVNVEMYEQ